MKRAARELIVGEVNGQYGEYKGEELRNCVLRNVDGVKEYGIAGGDNTVLLLWRVEEFWSFDCTMTSSGRPTSGEGIRAHHGPQSYGGPKPQELEQKKLSCMFAWYRRGQTSMFPL